ncbi:uncharacterized protein TrAtP1_001414 [Trichoderma atroviride]|uniref:uncharacterized protein n=1 Tax=Hypocrea atroviridis TaxID=63577 RepID=UPI003323BBE6|nr:hypothetical protein TrAtP1_001414 [Trichoderma atroviride]
MQFPDPSFARILENTLTRLCRLSDSCLNYADGTEKAFDAWLLCVTVSRRLQTEAESSFTAKEVEYAENAAEVMLKSLNKAEAAFRRANDDIPTARETGAMGAINAISQAGPSIVAQTFPAFINGGSALAQTDATLPTDPVYAAGPLLAPFLNDMYSYIAHGPNDGIYWAKSRRLTASLCCSPTSSNRKSRCSSALVSPAKY